MKFILSVIGLLFSSHLFSLTDETDYKIDGLKVVRVSRWIKPTCTTFSAMLINRTHVLAEKFTAGPLAGTINVHRNAGGHQLNPDLYYRIKNFYEQMEANKAASDEKEQENQVDYLADEIVQD